MEALGSDSRLVMIATLAHPKDLCCMEASVDVLEKRHSSAKSIFHYRILKCRQLIFSESQIIAAPVLDTESRMYIVMDRKYYESREINGLLEKMKISGNDPVAVTNDIFERCLQYTVTTKIAPVWNQVKGYLVCGRNFLTSNEALPAVKLQIIINESKALMVVWSLRLMLEQIKLEDLGISQKVNQDFIMHSISTISESNIEAQWIHILPNYAKGQIMQITHHIPETCPYKTYKEMKRHWKNMHGYRLPEEEEEELTYYTISNLGNDTRHVVPSSCVRMHDVILLNQINPIHVLEWFHDVLLRKVPVICGQNIFTNRSLAYAYPKEEDLSLDMYLSISLGSSMNDIIESQPVTLSSNPNSSSEVGVSKADIKDIDDQNTVQEDGVDNEISQSENVSSCDDKLSPDVEVIEKPTELMSQHKPVVNCDTTKPSSFIPRKPLQDIPQVLNLKNIENWPGSLNRTDVDVKSLPLSTKKNLYPENCHNDTRFIQTTLSRIALSAQKIEAVVSSSGAQGMQSFYTFPAQNLLMEQTRVSSQTCLTLKDMLSSGNQQVNIISSNGQAFMPEKEINLKRDASLLGQSDILVSLV